MAKGFKKGGYNPLNFKVVAYATEEDLNAATPKENTIGVVTTDTITSWMFSETEPTEPMEGMVWFYTGTPSTVQFNALKKGNIQVYPIAANQYLAGAWKDLTAKSYRGEKWDDWSIDVFSNGTLLEGCTVGIIPNSVDCSVAVSGTDIVFTSPGNLASGNRGGGFYFEPTFYVTGRKKLYVDATVTLGSSTRSLQFGFRNNPPSIPDGRDFAAHITVNDLTGGRHEYELDISELSGYMYLLFYGYALGKANVRVHDIRIE